MRLFTLCSSALVAIATTSGAQVTPQAAVPPIFKSLFAGTLNLGEVGLIDGPYGTRILGPVSGGNLTDTAGNFVATILASADTGIISNTGFFYPQVIFSLRWEVDQKYAYLNAMGVGKFNVSDLNYLHLETDSETYKDLNTQFLLVQVDFDSTGHRPNLTIFGAQQG